MRSAAILTALVAVTALLEAACGHRDAPPSGPPDQRTAAGPPRSSPAAPADVALPSPTAMDVDWPPMPPPAALGACATPDVPFGQSCPREELGCVLAAGKRVRCRCEGSEWRCLSGTPACFAGVRGGAGCSEPGASCELGNGLVFRTCACRSDARWACTGYGL